MVLLPLPALAIVVPSAVDPSHIQPGVSGPPEPALAAPGDVLPAFPKAVELPPSPSGETVRFVLKNVAIEGMTVYPQNEFWPLYNDLIGKIVPVTEAQSIANSITARYRADGYVLSQAVVPKQDLRDGTLHIRVVEGYIDRVVIQGDDKETEANGLVAEYGRKIAQERPLKEDTLERYLLLMNQLPGLTARSTLEASANNFGAANLIVTLARKDVNATLVNDNRLTRYIGGHQQTLTLAGNSLAGLDERTQLQASIADPASAMHMLSIQHEEPIGSEGTKLIVSASQASTMPGLTLAALQMQSIARDVQVTVQHPFILQRTESLTGRAMLDYRNTDTTVFGTEPLSSDRTRALRVGGDYNVADRIGGSSVISMLVSRGLPVLNPTSAGDLSSQAHAPEGFLKANLDMSRIQPVLGGLSVYTGFSGQASANPLLSSEQFSLGGPAYGSAYDPGVLAGDMGIAFRGELRYGDEGNGLIPINSWQAYGFYDIGKVWNKTKTPTKDSLASAGFGTRLDIMQHLSGNAELAFPLTRNADIGNSADHDVPRLFVGLQADW